MPDARSEILSRIRQALSDHPEVAPIPRTYNTTRPVDDPAALFTNRATDYRATVHRVRPRQLPSAITAALARRNAHTMAVPPDVPSSWCVPNIDWHIDDPPLPVSTLDELDGVLTGCAAAIAETGTLILDTTKTQGRRALTLIPDYHLCVVRTKQVVATVPEALASLDPTRPLTLISGPSATSDIELNRIEGVHGPRTLEILLVG